MEQTFDADLHQKLLLLLARSDYAADYLKFCQKYSVAGDIDGPRLKMADAADMFRSCGVSLEWNKKFKVFRFDHEEIAGWTWFGSLVVQRYDALEPMMEGEERGTGIGVGSTLLDIAINAGELRDPPILIRPSMPTRPQFDGDMETMQRMIPDLIALFRSIKDIIRQGWP